VIRHQLPAYSPLSFSAWARASMLSAFKPREGIRKLADALDARYGPAETILTGSGTEALELALRLATREESRRRPVGLPAYGCYDLVTAAVGANVPVLFYDLHPHTLTPDPESVVRVLTAGAVAVVVANLFGYPVDWEFIQDRCRASGAILIEDAAQGLGSSWRGRPGGTFGDLTVLSLGRGKGWTGGSGGILLVRTQQETGHLQADLESSSLWANLTSAARSFAQWALGRPALYGIPRAIPGIHLGETRFRNRVPPARIAAFSAALASGTWTAAEEEVIQREATARKLRKLVLEESDSRSLWVLNPVLGGSSAYLRLPLLVEGSEISSSVPSWAQRAGVAKGYPRALPDLPQTAPLMVRGKGDFHGARKLAAGLITLPTHSRVSCRDFSVFRAFLRPTP